MLLKIKQKYIGKKMKKNNLNDLAYLFLLVFTFFCFANSIFASDFEIQNRTGSSLFFLNGSSGYVGVGVSSPSYKLEVNGNISLNDTLYVNEDGKVGINKVTPVGGALVVNTADVKYDWDMGG